ncbi:tetratricopeptide repeat protein [Synechococcus sp. AH-779-G23]|nr:tetratricopeptide repeat protein [Synechococcus sp. AH-779-G23]MDA9638936.1 tetratricopeptide repeat protein [Synechococcus sp. AH-779-G23]
MISSNQLLELFRAGKYRNVLDLVVEHELSLETDPLSAQIVAATYFQLGDFALAEQTLEPHQASLGTDGSYLSLYGATCRRLGMLLKAKEFLSRALKIDPLSPSVRNNYANLLIDLDDLPEARVILDALISENPDYDDARSNLNRLSFRENQSKKDSPFNSTVEPGNWIPGDPLMLAFSEEEVKLAGAVNFANKSCPSASHLVSKLPDPDKASNAADQLKLAVKAIQENKAEFALQLVTHAYKNIGAQASIYINAADAYIRLKRFQEAEICLLQNLQLAGPSLPAYVNLCTFACMRGDYALARHYLDSVLAVDPGHPQVAQLSKQIDSQSQFPTDSFDFVTVWNQPAVGDYSKAD